MTNIVLNSPNCPSCAGGTSPSNAGVPPWYALDTGKLSLVAGVTQTVTFTNIKNTTAAGWSMPKPKCVNAYGSEVFPVVTELATGFTVVADEDCTFSYVCIKIL